MRNTEALIENLNQAIQTGQDPSLSSLGIEPYQALTDLQRLGELIHTRLPEQQAIVERLYLRYARASALRLGQLACLVDRLRLSSWTAVTCGRA